MKSDAENIIEVLKSEEKKEKPVRIKKSSHNKSVQNGVLTEFHEKFCEEYTKDNNAAQAYIRAGSKCDPNNARDLASQLMKTSGVKNRITSLRNNLTKKLDCTLEWKMETLMKIIELGMQNIYDNYGNIRHNDLKAAIAAICELNRMQGHHAAQKVEIGIDFNEEVRMSLEIMHKYEKGY